MDSNLQNQLQQKYKSLTERLNELDQYAAEVNPMVRGQMLDFSNRPEGYNPLNDIRSAIEFSERSRDIRSAAGQEQNAVLEALMRASESAVQPIAENKFLETLKLEAAKQDIKTGKIKLNLQTGALEQVNDEGKNLSETSKDIVSLVDDLLKKNTKPITGFLQIESMIPGTGAKQTQALYDRLKGIMSLENRQLLKGSGAISDYEAKILERASSSLNRDLSDEDFRKTLEKIKEELTGEKPGKGKVGKFTIEEVK